MKKKVISTKKDLNGDILSLCNKLDGWSVTKADAIRQIKAVGNANSPYYTIVGVDKVRIHVIDDSAKGKYLRTDRDKTTKNNLAALPDC